MRPLIPWFSPPVLQIPVPDAVGRFLADVLGLAAPIHAVPVHGFGVLVAAGFLLGGRVAMERTARVGLDAEHINKLLGWLVIGTFVGGHVGYGLMYRPAEFFAQPALFLKMWDGLASWGGFAVCVPLALYYFRSRNLPFWPYIDSLAIGLGLGWFLGRMGCFVAHDHIGPPTNFFLGVYGICEPGDNKLPGIACHDVGLYEGLWSLITFGAMLALDRAPRVPGFYALFLGLAYTPMRFALDFLRPDGSDHRYLGFTPAQYWCVIAFIGCAFALRARLRSGDAPVWAPPGSRPPVDVSVQPSR